jgi:hypothetical protein
MILYARLNFVQNFKAEIQLLNSEAVNTKTGK